VVDGWGTGNVFSGNTATVDGAGYAIHLAPVLGNVVRCSNTETGARHGLSNVACKTRRHTRHGGSTHETPTTTVPRPTFSVLGTGYLGATHAICMASIGFDVIGVDVDVDKIAALSSGAVPFFEPATGRTAGIDARVRTAAIQQHDRRRREADIHSCASGRRSHPRSHAADLRYVHQALDSLAPHLDRKCLVVGKSNRTGR